MEGCPHVSSRIVDDNELIVGILFSQLLDTVMTASDVETRLALLFL